MKTIKFKNIQGGSAPYSLKVTPIGVGNSDFNNVPNGKFRTKVIDSANDTTLPKIINVFDPTYVTDRTINWHLIPTFSLPSNLMAIWGWGSPRYLDEAQPTDALNHGWTHTDNNRIDGVELTNAKRQKTVYFPFSGGSSYNDAINDVKAAHPTAVQAAIVQTYSIHNPTNAAVNYSYINHAGSTITGQIQAAQSGIEEIMNVDCLFGNDPNTNGLTYNAGDIRIFNPNGATDDAFIALGRAFYNREKWVLDGATNNPTAYRVGVYFWNEETLPNAERMQLMFKGMSLEAASQSNPFKLIYYGKLITLWGGGYYSGQQNDPVGWKLKAFPHLSNSRRAEAEVLSVFANMTALGDANCVYVDSGSPYYKVPFPQTNTKYQKQNGAYMLDQDGERKWRVGDFSETIRGINVVFKNDSEFYLQQYADPSYGYPNNKVSEMYWAVYQFYAAASYMIYTNIALAQKYRNNKDIYAEFGNDVPVKNIAVIRDETETTFPGHSNIVRPITAFQVEHAVFRTYALCEAFCTWTDYNNQTHPNENLPFAARNKGNGHANQQNPSGNNFQQFSQFEEFTWALKYLAEIHTEHNIFGAGNKKIVAYAPADVTHEIMILGRVNANKVWVFASEPRLDPDEKITVKMKNKKNNYERSFEVLGGECFVDVFVLPTGVTYEPADIVFEYSDLYGQPHKVSGDLRQHLVS